MEYSHLIIMLPGFSMNKDDMVYYKDKINETFPEFKIRYRILSPPMRKITIYNDNKYNAWYDYFTPHCDKEPEINIQHLLQSRRKIHKILDDEILRMKDKRKIYLLGMSQGCCMALDAGMTYNTEIGGIIGFKGHVTSQTLRDFQTKQRVWVCHGLSDKTIFYNFSKRTYGQLRKKNPSLTLLTQENVNHSVPSGIIEQMKRLRFFYLNKSA